MPTPPPQQRYEHKPFVGSSHFWAIEQLRGKEPGAKVLDIGPGAGAMGRHLKDAGANYLAAVEIDPDAQAHVREIYDDVEDSVAPFMEKQFSIILLLDVLEHMADPFSFLEEVSHLLRPDGIILVSVPNIAHWSIRLTLLFGFFEYTNRGILDRTHLQFFNRRRFLQLLSSSSGCTACELNASIEPAELVLPKPIWENSIFRAIAHIRWRFANLLPGFLAYQHLAVLAKNPQAQPR